jgi:hypothetical protein
VNSRVNRTRLGFSSHIEQSLLKLRDRFDVREVRFDPYQMLAVAQRRVHDHAIRRFGCPSGEASHSGRIDPGGLRRLRTSALRARGFELQSGR